MADNTAGLLLFDEGLLLEKRSTSGQRQSQRRCRFRQGSRNLYVLSVLESATSVLRSGLHRAAGISDVSGNASVRGSRRRRRRRKSSSRCLLTDTGALLMTMGRVEQSVSRARLEGGATVRYRAVARSTGVLRVVVMLTGRRLLLVPVVPVVVLMMVMMMVMMMLTPARRRRRWRGR